MYEYSLFGCREGKFKNWLASPTNIIKHNVVNTYKHKFTKLLLHYNCTHLKSSPCEDEWYLENTSPNLIYESPINALSKVF